MAIVNPGPSIILAQSFMPVVQGGSGTMNDNQGSLTLTTALAYQPAGVFLFMASASAGLSAQLYYATASSTTAIQLWQDAGATVKATSTAGAYTAVTTQQVLATVSIPAGLIGANGAVEIYSHWQVPNNANGKNGRILWNGATTFGDLNLVSTQSCWDRRFIGNRNSQSAQFCGSQSAVPFGTSGSATQLGTINTAFAVTLTFEGIHSGAATDYIILNGYYVVVWPKA